MSRAHPASMISMGVSPDDVSEELILQTFRRFTYITAHSPTLPLLYLRHSSFPNPSVASPTSQLILQPFFHFSYVTNSSLNSPGEPPMLSVRALLIIYSIQYYDSFITKCTWSGPRHELRTPAVGGELLTNGLCHGAFDRKL